MKSITKYVYTCTNAIFNYLQKGELNELIDELRRVEKHAYNDCDDEDKNLWFKFGTDDTLVTTINNIIEDLSLPKNHPNHQFLIERFKLVIGLKPDDELRVFYS